MTAVLVSGGAGYIGAHVCKSLAQAGYLPVTVDNLSTGHAAAVNWGPFIQADIRDRPAVLNAITTYGISSAVHLAAYSQIGESLRNPAIYYDNNVAAATEFVSALVDGGVKSLVFSSTAAAYGRPNIVPIPESHPLQPINPYGASKVAFEQFLHWMSQAHGLRYTTLRYFNAAGADLEGEIGESHSPETHLLPLICQAPLGLGKSLTVFGSDYATRDGTAERDYIHVADLANAHVAALKWLMDGGNNRVFNVGTGRGVTVLEMVKAVERVLGVTVPFCFGPRRKGDPETLVAEAGLINRELGWFSRHSDIDTLVRTASAWVHSRRY